MRTVFVVRTTAILRFTMRARTLRALKIAPFTVLRSKIGGCADENLRIRI